MSPPTRPFSGRSVLVTGGLGFVGQALSRALADAGAQVGIVDTFSDRDEISNPRAATVYSTDIRDTEAVRRIVVAENADTVFHLAAMHFLPDCEANPGECLSINVEGTESLLNAVRGHPTVQRIVFASSAAVYASSARAHREDAEVDPIDTYGTSKALAEQALRRFAAATGVTVHIARLFNVYGPGETNPHFVPTVFQQAKDGDVLQLGNLATERDYVFLDDVVDALLRMSSVRSPSRMTTVNVGTGAGLTGAAMVDAIAAVLGRELVVRTTASRMRRSDRSRLVADADYACQLLEWKARTRLEDGLRQCAARPVASGRMPSLDSTATL